MYFVSIDVCRAICFFNICTVGLINIIIKINQILINYSIVINVYLLQNLTKTNHNTPSSLQIILQWTTLSLNSLYFLKLVKT